MSSTQSGRGGAAAARARAARSQEEVKEALSCLPRGLRDRRLAASLAKHTEFLDVDSAQRCLEVLLATSENELASEARRKEARFLSTYLRTWMGHLKCEAEVSSLAFDTSDGPGVLVKVLRREMKYFSRFGAGRRYTTLHKHEREKGGKCVEKRLYGERYPSGAGSAPADRAAYGHQGCPRSLRTVLCGRYCHDVDIKNCHPCIAEQLRARLLERERDAEAIALLQNADMPTFRDYALRRDDRPDGWVEFLSRHHSLAGSFDSRKDCVKSLFCRLMFGGSYEAWIRTPYADGKESCPQGPPHEKVLAVEQELRRLRQAVFRSSDWLPFVRHERARIREANERSGRPPCSTAKEDRTIFSRIMQTIENDLLQYIVESLQTDGWLVTSLIFDGCHVLHRHGVSLEAALRSAELRVYERTGYRIQLVEKPLFGRHEAELEWNAE